MGIVLKKEKLHTVRQVHMPLCNKLYLMMLSGILEIKHKGIKIHLEAILHTYFTGTQRSVLL